MFNTQDEVTLYVNSAGAVTNYDVGEGATFPLGFSVSSINWSTTAPLRGENTISLKCATSSGSSGTETWKNNGNRSGFIQVRQYCPANYKEYVTCSGQCTVGVTGVPRNYQTTTSTSTWTQATTTIMINGGSGTSTYTGPNYHDWLLMNSIFLFIIFFGFLGKMLLPAKKAGL